MSESTRTEELTKAIQALAKLLAEGDPMVEEIMDMNADQLHTRILESQQNLLDNERTAALDDKLARAKLTSKRLEAPYKEATKLQTTIIRLSVLLLEALEK